MPSIWSKILTDVKALVVTVQPTALVKIRKRIKRYADEDLPLIIISPLRDIEIQEQEAYESQVHINYEVLIAIIYDGNQKVETELANVLDAREAIRHALHVTSLATATSSTAPTGVYDSQVELNPVYEMPEFDKNYDYSTFSMIYWSKELRTS